jgi:MFS family permease
MKLFSNPLQRRLLPLYVASFFQWMTFWVATEKLFMTEIGFDAAAIGLMAAVYAVFVPLIEIPSGILADRWSRKNVLIIASVASIASALVGGLSYGVPAYFVSALILGIFFALASGTFESVVYDTVLEEEKDSKSFEKSIGKVRLFSSIGGLIAAITGGIIATALSPRATFFATIPAVAISVWALWKFKEPQLHKSKIAESFTSQIAVTYKTILKRGKSLPIVAILVLTSMLVQVLLEFGQLWLVELDTPTALYGLAFGGLTAALGFGGLLAGRIKFHKPLQLGLVIATLLLSSLAMVFVRDALVVSAAQIVIITLVIVISVLFTRLMHDEIPSKIRSGVASGVSAFAWMAFVPFSLLFGWITDSLGVFRGGWMVLLSAAIIAALLIKTATAKDFKEQAAE